MHSEDAGSCSASKKWSQPDTQAVANWSVLPKRQAYLYVAGAAVGANAAHAEMCLGVFCEKAWVRVLYHNISHAGNSNLDAE